MKKNEVDILLVLQNQTFILEALSLLMKNVAGDINMHFKLEERKKYTIEHLIHREPPD